MEYAAFGFVHWMRQPYARNIEGAINHPESSQNSGHIIASCFQRRLPEIFLQTAIFCGDVWHGVKI
jgi:hypothetical protein